MQRGYEFAGGTQSCCLKSRLLWCSSVRYVWFASSCFLDLVDLDTQIHGFVTLAALEDHPETTAGSEQSSSVTVRARGQFISDPIQIAGYNFKAFHGLSPLYPKDNICLSLCTNYIRSGGCCLLVPLLKLARLISAIF